MVTDVAHVTVLVEEVDEASASYAETFGLEARSVEAR